MNVLLLNGSPKRKFRDSEYFLNLLKLRLTGCSWEERKIGGPANDAEIFAEFTKADAVVFAMPVYLDAVPSHVLRFLREAEKFCRENNCRFRVYGIANCGFFEGKQTRNLMNVMSCWCGRAGVEWSGGIGIGAGEMLTWIQLDPLIEVVLAVVQLVGGLVSQLPVRWLPLLQALAGVDWLSFFIGIAVFFAFSFGLFRAVWILGGWVKKGREGGRLYTGLTCCPKFLFMLVVDLFWIIRAAFHGVDPVRLFRKAR